MEQAIAIEQLKSRVVELEIVIEKLSRQQRFRQHNICQLLLLDPASMGAL